jgi:threonine/homoserine/homoserine lactone efflux protein
MNEILIASMAVIGATFLIYMAYQMGKQDGFGEGSEYAHMMALDKVHDLSDALDGVFKG